ncbi:MAG: sulfite exporter TauE/SafE family protein [Candidatus Verstraetearchaeota archaeon]|nr:sulfite exporter TauE/SafE family protein [Candidatus Verstraetearchaeota archaeon]
MDPLIITAILAFGAFAGLIGVMLGLGGGVFMIIFFILALNIPAHQAVALSLLAVIASSSMGGSVYVRDKMTNVKLAMVLETCTVTGAVLGVFLALAMPASYVQFILGVVLFYTSFMMLRGRRAVETPVVIKDRLTVSGEFYDDNRRQTVKYSAIRMKIGLFFSLIAGAISGIIGIGGGVIMVPIMNLLMKIPMKASAATSNFMVGVTAAASAFLYLNRGFVDLYMAVPSVLGIMIGAYIGTRLMVRAESAILRRMLSVVLVFFGIVLLLNAGGILVW